MIVNTDTREFHYPEGDDNVYSEYKGESGIPIGGLFNKLLFSLRFRAFNVLISKQLTADSRILIHRNISDRAETIAPFLLYDRDPYMVISEGQLFWILDAYTITNNYPYSTQATQSLNYIRNSVKVVIDAYDGTVTYYLADAADPIAATISKIFPDLFTPIEAMSADLRSHVRYPQDIFTLQTEMFSTYHMTNPAVFYNKEDQWDVPAIESDGRTAVMEPYYTIMKLPGEQDAEFIQMLPFTPRRKNNLAAWMVARSDGEHYGKLMVFQFPKQKLIFGPQQIVSRINQDEEISPQITLWNQQGSQVIQGTLLVVPIEESLLYIRPLYLRAADGQIPELKRVILAYQNEIVMEETLALALNRLFGVRAPDGLLAATTSGSLTVGSSNPTSSETALDPSMGISILLSEALQQLERALEANREGDWSRFGSELNQLHQFLEQNSTSGGG